jgi:hypothetical protein
MMPAIDSKQIDIRDLVFDERIADFIENRGKIFPPDLLNSIEERPTFKMSEHKLDNIFELWNEEEQTFENLPPITVEHLWGNKYNVLNGRHRLCAHIMSAKKTINATVMRKSTKI